MRGEQRTNTKNTIYNLIFFLSTALILSSLFTINPASASEEKRLIISIFDHNSNEVKTDNVFIEERAYDICVAYVIVNDTGVVIDRGIPTSVTITVPWGVYVTPDTIPEVTITAPRFDQYHEFVITAEKTGYTPAKKNITVIKGELHPRVDRGIIQEGLRFTVTVSDQDNNPVSGALVFINRVDGDSSSFITNQQGVVYLSAPEIDTDNETMRIIAIKEGYIDGVTTIMVEDTPSIPLGADISVVLPVIIAVIAVILAMVIVRLFKPASNIEYHEEPTVTISDARLNHHGKEESPIWRYKGNYTDNSLKTNEGEPVHHREPRIEEIRIYPSVKKKETTELIDKDVRKDEKPLKGRVEDIWYTGTDDVRYAVDKLTERLDGKQKDKWFEGTDDIRAKVDETLKKKLRSKKEE